jgi:hypothetical protein
MSTSPILKSWTSTRSVSRQWCNNTGGGTKSDNRKWAAVNWPRLAVVAPMIGRASGPARAACAWLVAAGIVAHTWPTAATGGPASGMFSREALARAVAATPAWRLQLDPRTVWSRVRDLRPNTDIAVVVEGRPASLSGALTSADDAGLSLRVSSTGQVEHLARPQVLEVRAATRFRGSRLAAVLGGTAGGVLGFSTAVYLAQRECGGNCGDEKAMIGLSLVGMPVGGALAGYFGFGRRMELKVVYVRP